MKVLFSLYINNPAVIERYTYIKRINLQVRSKTHVLEEGDLSEDQEEIYETELSQLFSDEDEVKSGEERYIMHCTLMHCPFYSCERIL